MRILYITVLLFCLSAISYSQLSTFTLSNGIEIQGKIQSYSRDSITLLTPEGKLVTFAMHEISQKNTRSRQETVFKDANRKLFFQTSFGLGFSGHPESFITGVRLDVEGLYKPFPTWYGYGTLQTGYELLQGIYSTSFIPITAGYQGHVAKWSGTELHWNAKAGYGVAINEPSIYDWEQREINGGLRYEFGLSILSALQGNTAFRLGTSILFQRANYHIVSDWSRQDIHQTFRRIFIHAGIMF